MHNDELRGGWWVKKGMAEQAAGNRSGMPPCTYEYNTGVMMIEPLNRSAFQQQVVAPITCGRVDSRDGSDQGALNSLVHGHGLFPMHGTLSSTYNAVHRVEMLRGGTWRRWDPSIVHIVGARKPWGDEARRDATAHKNNVSAAVRIEQRSLSPLLCPLGSPHA